MCKLKVRPNDYLLDCYESRNVVFSDHPTVHLFQTWASYWCDCGPSGSCPCLDLFPSCISYKQGTVIYIAHSNLAGVINTFMCFICLSSSCWIHYLAMDIELYFDVLS